MSRLSERNKQVGIRKGAWTHEEDLLLTKCIEKYGEGKWRQVPLRAGLRRCRKSCRLRWLNYLRPGIKRGEFADDEVDLIIRLHKLLGNKWSLIAGRIPGRTANDIKNYWNAHLKKKLASKFEMEKNNKTIVATNMNTKLSSPSGFTVIRPQPRTLSKARRIDGLIGTTTKANICSTTTTEMNQSTAILEDQTSWWKSFLLNCDVDEGCRSSSSGNGVGEEPFDMFWERDQMEGVGWEDLFFNNVSDHDLGTVGLLSE